MGIPIVVGVTGHRDIVESDIPKLCDVVREELTKLKTTYGNSEIIMLNSLASGADTLCAKVAFELGIKVISPLPMEKEEYEKDFSEEELIVFKELLSKTESYFVAPIIESVIDSRDFLYRQAGLYIASHCHLLIALWDGSEPKESACGTSSIVEFMLMGVGTPKNDGAVIHIATPRKSNLIKDEIKSVLLESEDGNLEEVLLMTDEYNRDSKELLDIKGYNDELLPKEYTKDFLLSFSTIYKDSDKLSMHFQKKYLNALTCFSIFGVLLVLCFLIFSEMKMSIALLFYGIIMLLYFASYIYVKRYGAHKKYIQYRMLSETMRTQFYLLASGFNLNIGQAFTWTQKKDASWVSIATSVLLIGTNTKNDIPYEIIKEYWIDGQYNYHSKALVRDGNKRNINDHTAKAMLIASAILYIIVFALEFFLTPIVDDKAYMLYLLKVLLGLVSAVTVFLSNYYGKLSLGRKSEDHKKMASLYGKTKKLYESGKFEPQQLFYELAREEIIENGNWMSYCKENPPTFNL